MRGLEPTFDSFRCPFRNTVRAGVLRYACLHPSFESAKGASSTKPGATPQGMMADKINSAESATSRIAGDLNRAFSAADGGAGHDLGRCPRLKLRCAVGESVPIGIRKARLRGRQKSEPDWPSTRGACASRKEEERVTMNVTAPAEARVARRIWLRVSRQR
jgi:hypothetical protein